MKKNHKKKIPVKYDGPVQDEHVPVHNENWARNMQDRMDANLLKNGIKPMYIPNLLPPKSFDPYFPTGKAKQAFDTWAKQGRSKEQQWAVMNFLTGAGRVLWAEEEPQFSMWTAKIAEPGELARVMRKFERRHKDAIRMLWVLGIGILLLIVEVIVL